MICPFHYSSFKSVIRMIWLFLAILRCLVSTFWFWDWTTATRSWPGHTYHLQLIQKVATQVVFNLTQFSHIAPLLRSLHWTHAAAHIRCETIMHAYKAKNVPLPSYLTASLRASSTSQQDPPSLMEQEIKLPLYPLTARRGFSPRPSEIARCVFDRDASCYKCKHE